MRVLDLFCGRWGWSRAFAARGWECIGVDLHPQRETMPNRCDFWHCDVLKMLPRWLDAFDFIVASSPCEEFSIHGMKHFHPNPKYPEMGIKLFNHTRELCETSGLPYVMENVKAAEKFVGPAVAHCGPFYLWGNSVPPLLHRGITKGMSQAQERDANGKRIYAAPADKLWSTKRKTQVATIPPELANCVAEYAERILEQWGAQREAQEKKA